MRTLRFWRSSFRWCKRIARAVKTGMKADGLSIMQFNEAAGGQTVFHLHVHIIPHYEGIALRSHGGGFADPVFLKAQAEKIIAALTA